MGRQMWKTKEKKELKIKKSRKQDKTRQRDRKTCPQPPPPPPQESRTKMQKLIKMTNKTKMLNNAEYKDSLEDRNKELDGRWKSQRVKNHRKKRQIVVTEIVNAEKKKIEETWATGDQTQGIKKNKTQRKTFITTITNKIVIEVYRRRENE